MTFLLDTNAVIYHLRGAAELDALFVLFAEGTAEAAVSVITQVELLGFPHLTGTEETAINALLANFRIVDVNQDVARHAAAIRRKHRLPVPDCIIAATAITCNATLVSRDARIARVRGLTLMDPFAGRA